MKRFDIRNKTSGLITHGYIANAPMPDQPEWGVPEHQVPQMGEDGMPVLDADGQPVMLTIPCEYEVIVTDLTGTPEDPPMIQLRAERDRRLAACDWTQMPDSPLTAEKRSAWAMYRQQLRQLPDQAGLDLASPAWPTPPGGAA